MTDGLEELRRSNHITPDSVQHLVSMDRRELMAMLEADNDERSESDVVVGLASRRKTRMGYIGAVVAAAAAAIFGILMIVGEDSPIDPDPVGPAEATTDLPAPLLVEGVEESPTTTTLAANAQKETEQDETPDSVEADATDTPDASDAPAEDPESEAQDPPVTTEAQAPPKPAPMIQGPFDQSVDLLALHFDYAHLDDGHAAAAALEISTSLGLQPLVVAGTRSTTADEFVHPFESVMGAVWGDAWLNAQLDRANAVSLSADRWLATFDAGGRVWVAEGGVADFTAEVVREIQTRRPALDTRAAIHVVQHSTSNESGSEPESLRLVQADTTYKRIDDGNSSNGTAALNQRSAAFEAAALAGRHSTSWSAAFEFLPAAELDFSDTVEMLHIVGVGTHEVADPDGFANRFMR